jgi:signal transduction histidine kinase
VRLSIATKVFLGFVVVLISSAAVSLFAVMRVRRIGDGLSLISGGYFPLTREASSFEAFQKERERNTERLLSEPSPQARRSLLDNDRTYFSRTVSDKLARARSLVQLASRTATESPGDAESLQRIDTRLQSLGKQVAQAESESAQLDALLESPEQKNGTALPNQNPALRERIETLQTAERRVDYEVKALLDALQLQMNRGVAEAQAQERETRTLLGALASLVLGVGLLVTWLAQRALSPIATLTEAAQALGRGSPDAVAQVPERGGDELAVLAREFNAMAQRLAAREKQLRAQSEALVRSERLAAIGRIAAQITHEIRNPLSAIGLNAEELGERLRAQAGEAATDGGAKGEGASAAIAACDAIAREVDRLATITEEYLRYARLPRPQPIRGELTEALRELLDFVGPELAAAGVVLQSSLKPDLPALPFDPGQIRQLLLNLIRNAREAMPGGGTLAISTRRGPDSLFVEIKDSGPGIPPERMQRIFDPFFTTKERGTGLGLALSQEIAQEHGGELTCASTPGQGTAFTLRLPLEPGGAHAAAEAK